MLALSGCVYIPPLGNQFTEEKRVEIIVGETTKNQVVKLLGEPNLLKNKQFFIYEAQRSQGTVWIVFGYGYTGGIFPIPIKDEHFFVLLGFSDQDIVNRYEIESAKLRFLEGVIAPALGNDKGPLSGELLLKGKAKDLLGFEAGIGFNSLGLSSDGKIMGAAGFKLVGGSLSSKKLWIKNLDTGELRYVDTPSYDEAVFSPDLASVALIKRTVTILNTKTGKLLFGYKGHGDSSFWSLRGVSCLAYDQTGLFIATGGYQGNIHIWSSQTGKELVNVKGHDKQVLSIAWSPDGAYLATVGSDGFVKMWRSTTGEEVLKRKQNAGGLSFSPDGNMLAINHGSHFELWRIKYNSNHDHEEPSMELYNAFLLPYFTGTGFNQKSLAWSHDGRFLAVHINRNRK